MTLKWWLAVMAAWNSNQVTVEAAGPLEAYAQKSHDITSIVFGWSKQVTGVKKRIPPLDKVKGHTYRDGRNLWPFVCSQPHSVRLVN